MKNYEDSRDSRTFFRAEPQSPHYKVLTTLQYRHLWYVARQFIVIQSDDINLYSEQSGSKQTKITNVKLTVSTDYRAIFLSKVNKEVNTLIG